MLIEPSYVSRRAGRARSVAVALGFMLVAVFMLLAQGCTSEPPTANPGGPAAKGPSGTPVAGGPPPTGATPGTAPSGSGAPSGPFEQPMVGPAPTKDTATWLWIPGDYLLGALVQVDKASPLDGPQLQQFGGLMSELGPLAVKSDTAQQELMAVAATTLTPKQARELSSNRDTIVKSAVDADALIATLKAKAAGDAQPKSPSANTGVEEFPFVSPYLLAGLSWLEKNGAEKLTPAQAAALAPLVQKLAEQRKNLATVYPRIEKMMNDKQVALFVQTLVDMHEHKSTAMMEYPEVIAYFKTRSGGK